MIEQDVTDPSILKSAQDLFAKPTSTEKEVSDPDTKNFAESLFATPTPAPTAAAPAPTAVAQPTTAPKRSLGPQLAETLKQTGLYPSATSAIATGKYNDIRRKESGDWELPFMAATTKEGGVKEQFVTVGAALEQTFGGKLRDTWMTDSQPVQKVFHDFQQANNLSDEEMNEAWNDFWRMTKAWDKDEKVRLFSDGRIRLNPMSTDYFDDQKVQETLDKSGVSEAAKQEFKAGLRENRYQTAAEKIFAYESAANVAKFAVPAVIPAGQAVGNLLAPSEYADVKGYSAAVLNTPEFLREYETQVIDTQGAIGKWARGLATDAVLGFNKVATTGLGIGGLAGSEGMAQAAAAGSEAGGIVSQGKTDTGIAGAIVQELPSLAAQIVASQLTGGLSLAATGGRAAGAIGLTTTLATAGAQSAGMTYADQRAQGATDEEARSKAVKAGLNTAVITGIFQGLGAGGVERVASVAKPAASITLRDVMSAGTRQEVWTATRKFVKEVMFDTLGEASEEAIDTFTSSLLTANPDTDLGTLWNDTWEAAKVGGALGGAVGVASKVIEKSAPLLNPDVQQNAPQAAQAAMNTPITGFEPLQGQAGVIGLDGKPIPMEGTAAPEPEPAEAAPAAPTQQPTPTTDATTTGNVQPNNQPQYQPTGQGGQTTEAGSGNRPVESTPTGVPQAETPPAGTGTVTPEPAQPKFTTTENEIVVSNANDITDPVVVEQIKAKAAQDKKAVTLQVTDKQTQQFYRDNGFLDTGNGGFIFLPEGTTLTAEQLGEMVDIDAEKAGVAAMIGRAFALTQQRVLTGREVPTPAPTPEPEPEPEPEPSAGTDAPLKFADIEFVDNPLSDEPTGKASRESGKTQVANVDGRKIVLVEIDGVNVPFYLSTGNAGKKNVAAGKWYPILGMDIDGWLNKGSEAEINNYYGSQKLKAAALKLDQTLGTDTPAVNVSSKAIYESVNKGLTAIGITPTANNEPLTRRRVEANKAKLLTFLGESSASAAPESTPTADETPQMPDFGDIENESFYDAVKSLELSGSDANGENWQAHGTDQESSVLSILEDGPKTSNGSTFFTGSITGSSVGGVNTKISAKYLIVGKKGTKIRTKDEIAGVVVNPQPSESKAAYERRLSDVRAKLEPLGHTVFTPREYANYVSTNAPAPEPAPTPRRVGGRLDAGRFTQSPIAGRLRTPKTPEPEPAPEPTPAPIKLKGTSSKARRAAEDIRETLGVPLDPDFEKEIELDNGVTVEVDSFGDFVTLTGLKTPKESRGKGRATQALKEIVSLADDAGVPIRIVAEPFGTDGMNKAQLIDWYSKNGFALQADGETMIYTPAVRFSVDDKLIMRSTFTNEDAEVSFRGYEGDKAMVWTGRTQMAVPVEWLRRPTDPAPAATPAPTPTPTPTPVEAPTAPEVKLTPIEKRALAISKLKGTELRANGITYVPESVMTLERRKSLLTEGEKAKPFLPSPRGGPNIEVREWAEVTGDPYARGWAIIDRRKPAPAPAPTPEPTPTPTPEPTPTPTPEPATKQKIDTFSGEEIASLNEKSLPKGWTAKDPKTLVDPKGKEWTLTRVDETRFTLSDGDASFSFTKPDTEGLPQGRTRADVLTRGASRIGKVIEVNDVSDTAVIEVDGVRATYRSDLKGENWKRIEGDVEIQKFRTRTKSRAVQLFEESPLFISLIDGGGVMSMSAAKRIYGTKWYKANKSQWNGSGVLRKNPQFTSFYTQNPNASTPEELADDLYKANAIKGDQPQDLFNAIATEIASARKTAATEKAEAESLSQDEDFARATSDGEYKIILEKLSEGDTLFIDGVEVIVDKIIRNQKGQLIRIDFDGGKRFGSPTVKAEAEFIYVDDYFDNYEFTPDEGIEDEAIYGAAEDFTLESVTQDQLDQEAQAQRQRDQIAERQAQRLTGDAGIIVPDMFGPTEGQTPLFNERRDTERFQSDLTAEDAAYMAAVEAGDMETAQRMVDEAARMVGYDLERYHITPATFTTFRTPSEFTDKEGMQRLKDTYPSENSMRVFIRAERVGEITGYFADDKKAVLRFAKANNFDAVTVGSNWGDLDDIIVINPSQIKSADPIVRDDNGNIIPPSQRFNPLRQDIRYQRRPQGAKGFAKLLADGKVLLKGLLNPDFTTAVHEMAHAFEMTDYTGLTDEEVFTLKTWAGDANPNNRKMMERKASEKFARGWERYLADGKAPFAELQAIFDKMAKWMMETYKTITGKPIDVEISSEVRAIFDKIAARMVAPSTIVTPSGTQMTTEDGSPLPPAIDPASDTPIETMDDLAGVARFHLENPLPPPPALTQREFNTPEDEPIPYSLQRARADMEAALYGYDTAAWNQAAQTFGDLWDRVTNEPAGTGEAELDKLMMSANPDRPLTALEVARFTLEGLKRKMVLDRTLRELQTAISSGNRNMVEEKQNLVNAASARYQTMLNQIARSRTAAGRALNAWKYALKEDFSQGTLYSRALTNYNSVRVAEGKAAVDALPEAEAKAVAQFAERMAKMQAEIDALKEAQQLGVDRAAEQQAMIDALRAERDAAKAKGSTKVQEVTRRVLVDKVRKAAKEARERLGLPPIEDNTRYQMDSANDPTWRDRVIVLAEVLVANPIMSTAQFADRVRVMFGAAYAAVADRLRSDVDEYLRPMMEDVSGTEMPTPQMVMESIDGSEELTNQMVYDLAKAHVYDGARDTEVLDRVFNDLQEFYPSLTREDVAQLFTRYGETRAMNKSEEAKALRAAKSLELVQRQIDDLEARGVMKRTGTKKDDPDVKLRELRKKRDDLAKDLGYAPVDPETQLSSAQTAAKKRMKNEMEELDRAIKSNTPIVRVKRGVRYTEDMEQMRSDLEELRKAYADIFGQQRTPAERMNAVIKDLDRRIAKERELINKGILKEEVSPQAAVDSPEISARRELLKELKRQKYEAYDALNPNERALNQAMKAAQKALEARQKIINEGLPAAKDKAARDANVVPTAELEALWEAADDMDVLIREMRKNRPLTPAQQLRQLDDAYNTAVRTREVLRKRIADGDLVPASGVKPTVENRTRLVREENAELRKQITQMQRDAGVGVFAYDVREAKKVAALEKSIEELKRKRAVKDFSKRKTTEPVTSERIRTLELIKDNERREYEQARAIAVFKTLGFSNKALEYAMASWHARQLFNLSGDFGVFNRQLGKMQLFALWQDVKAIFRRGRGVKLADDTIIGKTLAKGFEAFMDERAEDRIYTEMATDPSYTLKKANGFDLVSPHESSHEISADGRVRVNPMFLFNDRAMAALAIIKGIVKTSAAVALLPTTGGATWKTILKGAGETVVSTALTVGGARFAKRVERANRVIINVARWGLVDAAMKIAGNVDPSVNPDYSRIVTEAMMTYTGKVAGQSGFSKGMKNNSYWLGIIFSFPQYVVTNMQSVVGIPLWSALYQTTLKRPEGQSFRPQAIAAVAALQAQYYLGTSAKILFWAMLLGVWDEEDSETEFGVVLNPKHPYFGCLKLGKTFIDLNPRANKWISDLSRMFGTTKLNERALKDGYLIPDESSSYDKNRMVKDLWYGQLNMNWKTLADLSVKGELYKGGELGRMGTLQSTDVILTEIAANLTARDVQKMYEVHGPVNGSVLSGMIMGGANVSVRETEGEREMRKAEERRRYKPEYQ